MLVKKWSGFFCFFLYIRQHTLHNDISLFCPCIWNSAWNSSPKGTLLCKYSNSSHWSFKAQSFSLKSFSLTVSTRPWYLSGPTHYVMQYFRTFLACLQYFAGNAKSISSVLHSEIHCRRPHTEGLHHLSLQLLCFLKLDVTQQVEIQSSGNCKTSNFDVQGVVLSIWVIFLCSYFQRKYYWNLNVGLTSIGT